LFSRFITGPAELKDIPTPRKPPKVFVNTDNEQQELILVCYKVKDKNFNIVSNQFTMNCIEL